MCWGIRHHIFYLKGERVMRRLKKIVSLCLAFLMLLTIFPQQVEAASYELHFTTIMFTKGAEQFHTYSYKLLDDWSSVKKKYKLNVSFLHLRA